MVETIDGPRQGLSVYFIYSHVAAYIPPTRWPFPDLLHRIYYLVFNDFQIHSLYITFSQLTILLLQRKRFSMDDDERGKETPTLYGQNPQHNLKFEPL